MIYLQMPNRGQEPGNHYLNFIDQGKLISMPVWTVEHVPVHITMDNDLGSAINDKVVPFMRICARLEDLMVNTLGCKKVRNLP